MKKVLLFSATVLSATFLSAQAFFEYTSYVGAFAPQPTARWTDGWTEFDPQNAAYPATNAVLTGNVTGTRNLVNDSVYYINDEFIYVRNGGQINIEEGTIIRSSGKGTLIVERGGKINAKGTLADPIIFTSAAPIGSRDYGDWGGVVVLGHARHNLAAGLNAVAEGGIGDVGTGFGLHGGSDDNDSSGVLSYVRIEFAGISLTPSSNSEINGLSMYSVGRKTQIDHIQVSFSGDDSFEWFGGTVNCKYIVAYHGWDDDFDTDNGFRGWIQFAASQRDSKYADQSGSNGFESDNDANGSTRQPKTHPIFSNVTIIGPNYTGNPDTTSTLYKRGAHVRRNTGVRIYNSIITGYPDAGFLIDGRKTTANYCGDTLIISSNILGGCNSDFKLASNTDSLCLTNSAAFMTLGLTENDTVATANAVGLVSPFNFADPDMRPTAASLPTTVGSDFSFATDFLSAEVNEDVNGMLMYPNPTEGFVNIAFNAKNEGALNINIIDLSGRTVKNMNNMEYAAGNNTFPLDIQGLSTGVYMVNIYMANSVKTQKLIVK